MTPVRQARLQDVLALNPELDAVPSNDEVVSFLPMSAIHADDIDAVDTETRRFQDVCKGYTPFIADDVLVAKITPCFENGKIAQAKPTRRFGFGSTEFHVLRPRAGLVDPRFLVHYLRQERIRKEGERKMTGSAGQRRVPEHFLANLRIPVPPLPEQRRIAEILDEADALRVKRRIALAQLDTLTQSIFLDLFGDPVQLEAEKLATVRDAISRGQLIEIQDGNHGEKHPKVSDFSEHGIPFITANCLNGGQLDLNGCYFLSPAWLKRLRIGFAQAGDVLISHKGSIGLTAVVPQREDPIILSPQVTYYRTNNKELLPEFLETFFQTAFFQAKMKKEAEQTTRSYLGITRQLDLPLIVPAIEQQHRFAHRLKAAGRLRAIQRESLFELDAFFATLQHRAFRGELS